MPKLKYRKIYDDTGDELLEGDEVIVNGAHHRIIFFNDQEEISLENWDMQEDFIFSIRKKRPGPERYDDIDDPKIDAVPAPSATSKSGRRADVV